MYFDSHAHYDDEKFDSDRHDLLPYLHENGVGYIVNPGQDVVTSEKARQMAEQYPFMYFAAGYHPHEAENMDESDLKKISDLLSHPKCVAVGEIGLDYFYDFSPRDVQKSVFTQHLELARSTGKPAIIHNRESTEDCMNILRAFPDVHGVVHCFSGSWETAKELLDMGWYISFTGAVTFKNARRAVEVAEKMPLERLMIETDSPYMAPEPFRGKRCDSSLLAYTARRIAELRGISEDEIISVTTENARKFFGV